MITFIYSEHYYIVPKLHLFFKLIIIALKMNLSLAMNDTLSFELNLWFVIQSQVIKVL